MNALEFAIQMEIDGEQYYLEQAKKNQGSTVEVVLIKLAEDEKNHANLLRSELKGASYELEADENLDDIENIFKNHGDFKSLKNKPDQLDIYRTALENEQKSIDLYNEFYTKADTDSAKNLFRFLVKEEQKHFKIIEHIVLELNKPNDWVESAEFGVRKEEY